MKASGLKPSIRIILLGISIIAIIVTIFYYSSDNREASINQPTGQLSKPHDANSIKSFQAQFCGINSKAADTLYVKEVILPNECSMPVGIYADNSNTSGDNIWTISTKNGILYNYNLVEGFKKYIIPNWLPRDHPTGSSMVWTIKKDNFGNLWFTDEKQNSIWRFDPKNEIFERYIIPRIQKGFGTAYPVSFDFDTKGNIYLVGIRITSLWYGNITEMRNNSSNGFYELPLPTHTFSEREMETLSLGSVLVQDNENIVWVSMLSFGNKGQILGYDTNLKNITKVFDLPADITSPVGMIDDHYGNLWVTDHGTSIFFRLNTTDGEITKYSTSEVDKRITGNNTNTDNAYTLPYWIHKANSDVLWFNEHTGNKIAKFITQENKLVEYWIPTQNRLFGKCSEKEVCGIANALQLSVGNKLVWFTEWTENKIGYIKINNSLPVDVDIDNDKIILEGGDTVKIMVNVTSNDTKAIDNVWEMKDLATLKENGSLNGTGLEGKFSEKLFNLSGGTKIISYDLMVSDDVLPGNYTLMLGIGNNEISVMKAVSLNIS